MSGVRPAHERLSASTALACVLAKTGRKEEALRILSEVEKEPGWGRYQHTALIYTALGRADMVVRTFERAYEEHDDLLLLWVTSPHYDELRSVPEFAKLLARLNL